MGFFLFVCITFFFPVIKLVPSYVSLDFDMYLFSRLLIAYFDNFLFLSHPFLCRVLIGTKFVSLLNQSGKKKRKKNLHTCPHGLGSLSIKSFEGCKEEEKNRISCEPYTKHFKSVPIP